MNIHIRRDLAIIGIMALASLLPNSTDVRARDISTLSIELSAPEPATTKLATTELVVVDDPAVIGQWSDVMEWPIIAVHASLLPNGKLLTWDATPDDFDGEPHENDSSTMRTDLWDPSTDLHLPLNPDTNSDMYCSGHAHLADGSLFVAGGDIGDNLPIDKTNIFSWQNNSWSSVSSMSYSRWYPSVAAMPNEEMLVIGGSPSMPEVWSAESNWRELTAAALPLANNYYHWIQPMLDGRALLFGPDPVIRILDTSGAGAWTEVGRRDALYRHYGIYAMYDVGKILIAGGGVDATNSAVTLDVQSGEVVPIPPMQYGRRQHNGTILADGTVLVSGGLSSGALHIDMDNPVYPAELWDPSTLSWTTMASMSETRQYHSTALLLPDGRVWSGGGGYCVLCREVGYEADSAEIFTPPYLFDANGSGPLGELAVRPSIAFAPQNVAYGQTFDLSSPNADEIAHVNLVRLSSVTHSTNMDQRFLPLQFDQNGQTLTIDAPSNAAIAPPGHYMLFILDGSGVPSEAAIVRFYNSPDSPTLVPTPVILEQLEAPTINNIVNWPDYDSEFLVTWSAVENVNQYELEFWSEDTDWELAAIVSDLEYQISNRPLGHWCFRARSVRANALASNWSNNTCTDVNVQLATPTSTPALPPTEIPTATLVPTLIPTEAATATLAPTETALPTDTPTLTPLPTDTPVPELAAPDLYKIVNGPDYDDYYTVEWSTISEADLFNLEEWSGGSGWRPLGSVTQNSYEIREHEFGYWCYRVQAQRDTEYSDWSVVQCTTIAVRRPSATSTTVSPAPLTPMQTATPTGAVRPTLTPQVTTISTATSTTTPTSTATLVPTATSAPTDTLTPTATQTAVPTSTATQVAEPQPTATATTVEAPTPITVDGNAPIPSLSVEFSAEQIQNGDYTVIWSALESEVGYELQTWTNSNGWITILAGTITQFDAQGYGAGTWCYRVRANTVDGSTQWSNVDCASVMTAITLLTQSSDPLAQATSMLITFTAESIPSLQWQGETGSKYHLWKSVDGRIENAVRITVAQLEDQETYVLDDISALADINEAGQPVASTYWLVERRGASSLVHGPFITTGAEPTNNNIYLPILNQ